MWNANHANDGKPHRGLNLKTIKHLWERATRATSTDRDDARREYMTKAVSVSVVLTSAIFSLVFFICWLLDVVPGDSVLITASLGLILMGAWLISMRGYWRFTAILPPLLTYCIAVYGNIIGGEGAPMLSLFALAIIMTALLHYERVTLAFVVICIATYAGLAIARYHGYLHSERTMETVLVNRIIVVACAYAGMTVLIWFLMRRYRKVLDESDKTAALLAEHAEKVSEINLMLEKENAERRRAQDALQESEERFRSLVNNIPDVVYSIDRKGNILSVNDESLRIFGYRKDEIVGKPFTNFIYPDDIPRVIDSVREEVRNRQEYTIGQQFRILASDGTTSWVEEHAHTQFDANGNFVKEEGVLRDVTDRRRVQEAVRDNERQMREILQGTPIPMFVIGKDHRIIHWNRAIEVYSGLSGSDMKGTSDHWKALYQEPRPCMADLIVDGAFELLPEWYGDKFKKSSHLANAYEGTDSFTIPGRGMVWMNLTAAEIRDSENNVIGAIETLEDITERRRAADALQESEERFRSLFEYSRDGIMIMEPPSWRFSRINKTGLKMFAADAVEISALGPWDLSPSSQPDGEPSEARIKAMIEKAIERGWCFYEWQFRSLDDNEFPATVLLSRIDRSGQPIIQMTVRDITESKRAEDRIKASLREKEVLLREIHHRVKNNFQVIMSLLNLQSRNLTDPELLKQFDDSSNRIRAMALVHEKLYQSSDLSEIDFSSYLKTITEDLARTYAAIRKRPQITIDSEEVPLGIDQAVPCGLIANELITNALKYAFNDESSGNRLSIKLRKDETGMITMQISDNGPGLPAGIDIDTTQTLGLQLVSLLTRQIRGTCRIDSADGTTWTIAFQATARDQALRT